LLPPVGGVAAKASSLATTGVDVVQVMLRQDLAGAGCCVDRGRGWHLLFAGGAGRFFLSFFLCMRVG
jgi:hypothetical protein